MKWLGIGAAILVKLSRALWRMRGLFGLRGSEVNRK